jgi:hypothetical protein
VRFHGSPRCILSANSLTETVSKNGGIVRLERVLVQLQSDIPQNLLTTDNESSSQRVLRRAIDYGV